MDLASALAELATISDQKTKIERYKAVLQDLLAQQHVAHLVLELGLGLLVDHERQRPGLKDSVGERPYHSNLFRSGVSFAFS